MMATPMVVKRSSFAGRTEAPPRLDGTCFSATGKDRRDVAKTQAASARYPRPKRSPPDRRLRVRDWVSSDFESRSKPAPPTTAKAVDPAKRSGHFSGCPG